MAIRVKYHEFGQQVFDAVGVPWTDSVVCLPFGQRRGVDFLRETVDIIPAEGLREFEQEPPFRVFSQFFSALSAEPAAIPLSLRMASPMRRVTPASLL